MLSVQAMKDSFYAVLRDRIAAGNASRTVVVRGVVRPGVVVVENELPGAGVDGIAPVDAFCLRWTGLRAENKETGSAGLVAATCEVRYATDGQTGVAGMNRGRALAAMDDELRAALDGAPQWVELTPGGARVFWSDVAFGPVVMRSERMERTATVEVFGYE